MNKLTRADFEGKGTIAAPLLIGTVMCRRVEGVLRRARLVEVEAYLGPCDLASHSSKGRTARTEVMFGPAGHAYVFLIYGMYTMFNLVVGTTGEAHAVLIRAAEPLDGWQADLTGPGKLARAFAIQRADNGLDLCGDEIYLERDPDYHPSIKRRARIGIDYARHWKNRLLRYVDVASPIAAKLKP